MNNQRIVSIVGFSVILGFAVWVGVHISRDYAEINKVEQMQQAQLAPEPDDGDKLVADALAIAKKDGKRVLMQFGSHGCTWCHVLQKLFETDQSIMAELKSDYVYVLIDITRRRNKGVDSRYGNPTGNGVPVIVILDADGKQLVTKGGGIVEGDPLHPDETYHISPVTMLSFLKTWAPNR